MCFLPLTSMCRMGRMAPPSELLAWLGSKATSSPSFPNVLPCGPNQKAQRTCGKGCSLLLRNYNPRI